MLFMQKIYRYFLIDLSFLYNLFPFFSFDVRDAAMASITERAQRMEKDLRESNAKHDRAAAELQVSLTNLRACAWIRARAWFHACGTRVWLQPCMEVHARIIEGISTV